MSVSGRSLFRSKGFDDLDQLGKEGQGGKEGDEHRHAGQQTEIYTRDEVGKHQNRETDDDGDRGVIHRVPDAAVGAVHGLGIIPVSLEFMLEPVNVMDRVIDRDTHADGSNGDRHQIEGDPGPAHEAQD